MTPNSTTSYNFRNQMRCAVDRAAIIQCIIATRWEQSLDRVADTAGDFGHVYRFLINIFLCFHNTGY